MRISSRLAVLLDGHKITPVIIRRGQRSFYLCPVCSHPIVGHSCACGCRAWGDPGEPLVMTFRKEMLLQRPLSMCC